MNSNQSIIPISKELDDGNFSTDSPEDPDPEEPFILNSDDEQLDNVPFLSHQLAPDQESFSEKFLRNILTHEYQNLMPRRREKFVEITKTVTVTEIVNGGADKHPSSCEVKVTNVSPAGPHPVNVSIKHLHQKWHSCDDLESEEDYLNNKKGTVIHIQETHKPYEEIVRNGGSAGKSNRDSGYMYEDVIHTKVEQEEKTRNRSRSQDPNSSRIYFDRSEDNIIDLEFTHPILIESTRGSLTSNMNGIGEVNGNTTTSNGRRKFADLRKKRVSTSTTTSTTEMEKVTTTTKRRSTSSHSSSSRSREFQKPEVKTLYYRKFVETNNDDHKRNSNASDSGASLVIHSDTENREETSKTNNGPVAPPRKRLGREESLHYYRDDNEIVREERNSKANIYEKKDKRRVTMTSPEPGFTSVSLNDTSDRQNLTAGITSVSMNDSCTDTSFESRFSTIPRSSKSTKINHIQVNVIGPTSGSFETGLPVIGRVGEDVTMNIYIEKPRRSASENRRTSDEVREVRDTSEPPPKPPRRSKWGDHVIGEPLATSTPMTTIERKQIRESTDGSEPQSRKSTRGSRPPDINIIGCETVPHDTRSPARTPCTPIVVVNQNPSRRSSQDLLADPTARRRKSTVTDIDWYAAFNMKDPKTGLLDERKPSRETKRRASESSAVVQPVDIDLNQIFTCTGEFRIQKDEKCQCNACQLIRMSESERALRKRKESRQYRIQSKTFSEHDSGATTLPSRHFTPPVEIILDDVFNPKPQQLSRPSIFSSVLDETFTNAAKMNIDQKQVTTTTNQPVHANDNENQNQLLVAHHLRGGIVQEGSEVITVTTMKTTKTNDDRVKHPRRASVTRRISVEELKSDEKNKAKKHEGRDIMLPPSDVSIDDIFTALSTKKEDRKSIYIVTRKQRAQDVDAIDFDENEGNTPIAPPREKRKSISTTGEDSRSMDDAKNKNTVEAIINLDDIFPTTERCTSLTNEYDDKISSRIVEFEKTKTEKSQQNQDDETKKRKYTSSTYFEYSLEDVFDQKPKDTVKNQDDLTREVDHTTTRVAEFEKNREDIHLKPHEQTKEDASVIQPNAPTDISLDDVFNQKLKHTVDTRDELTEEVDHITTRVAEFEKNREDIHLKPHERTKEDASVIQPTGPTNISLDDVFNQKPKHTVDIRDELTKEVDHITTRVAEFEKNRDDIHLKPHEQAKEDKLVIQPTAPTNISLDDVFNQKPKHTVDIRDELTKEVDHITTRVAEFEKNREDIHLKPHEQTKEDASVIQPTAPTDISLDDVFNQKLKHTVDSRDELTKEVDHITTRVAEFEKNRDDIHLKPHEQAKEDKLVIQPTAPTNISLDDVFNQKLKHTVDTRDELTKEVDHITTRVAEFEKNREDIHLKPHEQTKEDASVIQPTAPTDISLDDVFNQKLKHTVDTRDELTKEVDHITTRVAEFEKNREDIHLKPHEQAKEDALVIQPTAPTNISLDDVFNQKPKHTVDIRDELTKEVDHITTKVAEFEKNREDIHLKPHEQTKEDASVIQPTAPTDISLDDVFNQKLKHTVDSRDELTKEVDHITKRVAEFEKNRDDIHLKPHEQAKEDASVIQPTAPTDISLDDVFNQKLKHTVDTRDELTKEVDHITTRVAEFEKNRDDIHLKQHEQAKEDALVIQPTAPTNISLDDVFNQKPKHTVDIRDELTKEVDHITTKVAEFEKNREDIHLKPHEQTKEDASVIQPTAPTDISLDDVFNQKLKHTVDSRDELTKEVDHITTRVAEFEKNRDDIHLKPHEQAKEDASVIQPTAPTDISLDDVFNQKLKHTVDTRDELTKEVDHITTRVAEFEKNRDDIHLKQHEQAKEDALVIQPTAPTDISLDDVFNQKLKHTVDTRDELTKEVDHITTRIAEFEKNREDIHLKPHEQAKEDALVIQPTAPTNISLDDVFNQKPKHTVDIRDELTKEVDHITTRVAEFEKNREDIHLKPHEQAKEDALVIQPTAPTDISLDDVFNQKLKHTVDTRDELTKEVDHITTRVAEFEKNRDDIHLKQHEQAKEDALVIQPTAPTDISLDDVFNQKLKHTVDTRDELTKEVDHITTRVAEFEKNREDIHLKPHEQTKEDASVIQPTAPTDISLDDVFNQKLKHTVDSRDELTKEVDHITTRVAEFEKNREDIHLKPHEQTKKDASVIQPTAPTDISLDDIFNHQTSFNGIEPKKQVERETTNGTFGFERNTEQSTSSKPVASVASVPLDDVFPSEVDVGQKPFQVHRRNQNLLPSANWQDSFVSTTSTISLDDGFGLSLKNANHFGATTKEIIPTQTPPNSDSEQETKAKYEYPETVKIETNLEDVFNSPPMTEVPTVEPTIDRRKSLQLPVDNWIDEIVARTTDEATKEAPKTPKTPKTPVQLLVDESKKLSNFPSPTRISSEIQIEWIADILKDTENDSHPVEENFEQKHDKSWVSNAIYRPTAESSTYNLRASQVYSDEEGSTRDVEDEKPTTSSDMSWIEAMLKEIGTTPSEIHNNPEENRDAEPIEVKMRKTNKTMNTKTTTTTTTTTEDDNFLEEVFRKFECKHHDESKKCDCSACRLTMLSDEDLEELKRRWKERKNIEAQQTPSSSGTALRRQTSVPKESDISMDDIFSYSERPNQNSTSVNYKLTNSSEGHVSATKNQKPKATTSESIDLNDIFPSGTQQDLTINTDTTKSSFYSRDDQVPSTSSPPVRSTVIHKLSPTTSETVTRTNRWKEESDISLDDVFGTSSSRRFSNYYQDPTGFDTVRSEDSGVASGGGRITTDVVIDEAFKGVFDDQAPSGSHQETPRPPPNAYEDYYITSLNDTTEETDSEVDPNNLDVTNFVDDILGKSLDEAAFRTTTKSYKNHTDTSIDRKLSSNETGRLHPYYRTRTDTSIDNKKHNKRVVISEQVSQIEDESDYYNEPPTGQPGFSHDEIMNLIFVESKNEEDEPTSSSNVVETTTSSSYIKDVVTTKTSEVLDRPSGEEFLEIEIKPSYFIIKGSYSILIPKDEPLGQLLEKLRQQDNQGSLATLDFSVTRRLKKLLMSCLKEKALKMESNGTNHEFGISVRGRNLVSSIDHASATFLKMNENKYDPKTNPRGIVNFCTAENNLCTPLLEERFKHLELFFPNTEHLVRYPPNGGWPETLQALSNYFKEFLNAQVDPSELILTSSTRTGYDVVSYCLFEEDDILLTNGPVYTGTISNVNERAQCIVEVVPTDLKNPRLEVAKYEAELQKHHALDNTVSGIIIVNPHNPMGVVFPPEDVIELCNWASSNNLHVVIDEVFANCVFDNTARFKSFLTYRHRVSRPENVAYLWSVSKDFGLPGLKFAVIHSANTSLRSATAKLQWYYPCSPFVQDFTVKLLSDSDWLRYFHSEVNRRMSTHYNYTIQNLDRLEIPFVKAQAGIFVFADFSKYLTSIDEASELDLFQRLGDGGVMLTAGVHQKCHLYGWFRIVFACTPNELEEGFRRLYILLGSTLQPVGSVDYKL